MRVKWIILNKNENKMKIFEYLIQTLRQIKGINAKNILIVAVTGNQSVLCPQILINK